MHLSNNKNGNETQKHKTLIGFIKYHANNYIKICYNLGV